MTKKEFEARVARLSKQFDYNFQFETGNPGDGRRYEVTLDGRSLVYAKGAKKFDACLGAFGEGLHVARHLKTNLQINLEAGAKEAK